MWYLSAMRRCLEFHGRARRLEFWEFLGGWLLITMVAAGIDHMRAESVGQADNLFTSLVALIHVLPFCAVAARRSHDLNRTGWLAVFGLVPLLGFAMLLVWSLPGSPGANQYDSGPDSEARQTPPLIERSYTARRHADRVAPEVIVSAPTSYRSMDILDKVAELDRLAGLLFDGALTDEEFDALKQRLLA
jgi:uncharacterized membrane protein YhaH (DUF805 family)